MSRFPFSGRNGRPRRVRGAPAEEEEGRPQDVEEGKNLSCSLVSVYPILNLVDFWQNF